MLQLIYIMHRCFLEVSLNLMKNLSVQGILFVSIYDQLRYKHVLTCLHLLRPVLLPCHIVDWWCGVVTMSHHIMQHTLLLTQRFLAPCRLSVTATSLPISFKQVSVQSSLKAALGQSIFCQVSNLHVSPELMNMPMFCARKISLLFPFLLWSLVVVCQAAHDQVPVCAVIIIATVALVPFISVN